MNDTVKNKIETFFSEFAPVQFEKGEIIIGNFNNENPSRDYMEMVGDWMLTHRSENELIALAVKAGAKPTKVWVGQEPEGINLFLHIKC